MIDLEGIDWFVQKALIERDLPLMKVKYHEAKIKSIAFSVSLPGQSYIFVFLIVYFAEFRHGVQINQPYLYCRNDDIIRHIDNHINSKGQICYFFPGDLSYKSGLSCLYAIQAAIKWADCYNYWFKNQMGGWPCKEMPHGSYAPAYFNIQRPML
ncbi:hypothetical protein ACFQZI_13230 [Mucilaginibacter lutimaris]|uniref:DUF4262 domain-containing protein n=1 Tax=Mucilaginibacter lutimaris TaxID=931629 RepID=A0ABW2ZI74_9SPHI